MVVSISFENDVSVLLTEKSEKKNSCLLTWALISYKKGDLLFSSVMKIKWFFSNFREEKIEKATF